MPICRSSPARNFCPGGGSATARLLDLRAGPCATRAGARWATLSGSTSSSTTGSTTVATTVDSSGPTSNSCGRVLPRRLRRLTWACLDAARWALLGIVVPLSLRPPQPLELSGAGDCSAESARDASLGARVRLVVFRPDVLVGQMSVDLRRRYAGMSKKLLNMPERSPSTEKMRREAMP